MPLVQELVKLTLLTRTLFDITLRGENNSKGATSKGTKSTIRGCKLNVLVFFRHEKLINSTEICWDDRKLQSCQQVTVYRALMKAVQEPGEGELGARTIPSALGQYHDSSYKRPPASPPRDLLGGY
ncbi:hypothetical protein RRG08_055633 [Elysia crispata]|uniref:Uncharacterized protein n=1 Tax=Elysia crispata TaxID=231223 RepID=A0AAE0Z7W0_9GAST|nr:hypothetical protein RRG08_055633 [Elysia crispata]